MSIRQMAFVEHLWEALAVSTSEVEIVSGSEDRPRTRVSEHRETETLGQ